MEILVIVKGLVAISVSFIRKVRLLILFPFPATDIELRKTKQQAQSFLILPSGDEMEKKVWDFLGRRWSFATSQDLDEHSWRLKDILNRHPVSVPFPFAVNTKSTQ